jgi:hypothetical protein
LRGSRSRLRAVNGDLVTGKVINLDDDDEPIPTRFSRGNVRFGSTGESGSDPLDVKHFESAMGLVLDRLADLKGDQSEAMEAAVRRGVSAGVREAMKDEAMTTDFWRRGFNELAKHSSDGASQWVGKRILTALIVAGLIWGVTWLVQTGRLK